MSAATPGLVGLHLLAGVAVLAPWIAGERPWWSAARPRQACERAWRALGVLERDLASGAPGSREAAERALERLAALLPPAARAEVEDARGRLAASAAPAGELASVRERFPPGSVELPVRRGSPLVAALHPVEAGLQVLWCAATALGLLRWLGAAVGLRAGALAVLGLALAAGGAQSVARGAPDRTLWREAARAAGPGERFLFPPVPFGPEETAPGEHARPPGGEHPLGTDAYGRDLLSRIAWGARTSLTVGFAAMALHVLVGGLVGGLAGTLRGAAGATLGALIDGMQCFPTLFLALALMAFVQPGTLVVIVVIGLTGWPATARLVRAEALRVGRSDFVQAARVLGAGPLRVAASHVAPQVAHQVLVAAAFGVGSAILYESTLGFLGLGVPPPEASLGDLLRGARERLASAWWLAVFPGLFLAALLLSCQQVAEALRARAGPRPGGGGA